MAQVESLRTENKFKNTEVGEIPVEWEVCRLGDYAYIKARIGWRGLSASEYTEEGPLFISGNHISGTKILWDKCDHLSKFRYDESPEIKLKNGDVIISKDGTIGRLGYIDHLPQEATIGGTMMLIRPQERFFHSKYVYYYFQGSYFQNLIKEKVSGSSIPHIFQRDIVNLRIPLISLEEQKKIAQILSSIDWAIEKNTEIIERTKQLKKGLMQELLTGKRRVKVGNRKDEGESKFKKTEAGNIPVEWEVVKVKDVGEIVTGSTPSTKNAEYYNGEYLWATPANLGMSKYVKSTNKMLSRKGMEASRIISTNAILVVCIGSTIGKIGMAAQDMATNQQINAVIANNQWDPHFVYYWMLKSADSLVSMAGRQAVPIVNKTIFSLLPIAKPPKNEQNRIGVILSCVDAEIEQEVAEKKELEQLKKGLMQVLLTGKVRVRI